MASDLTSVSTEKEAIYWLIAFSSAAFEWCEQGGRNPLPEAALLACDCFSCNPKDFAERLLKEYRELSSAASRHERSARRWGAL
jgi:hypothetical protein